MTPVTTDKDHTMTPIESWIPHHCDAYTPTLAYWPRYPFTCTVAQGERDDEDDDAEAVKPGDVWIKREAMTPQQTQATIDALRLVGANLLQHADALAHWLEAQEPTP